MESVNGQHVHFGADGSQGCLRQILRNRTVRRVLLVSGKKSFEISGASSWVLPVLSDIEVICFRDFSENPDLADLQKALASFHKQPFNLIIAIGGGSVLDMAKLIGFFCASGLNPDSYLNQKEDAEFEKQFLVAIPTTAGTGSEATHFAVLYRDKVKYSVADKRILPDVAIVNPDLSSAMPPYLTACTGMDALAQAIESHWAVGATDESREYAAKAIQQSLQHLERAVNDPDEESRAGMAEAAYWAGRAINISKTTLCHALSYSITAHFNYPHGHAVALTLPFVLEYNLTNMPVAETQQILRLMNAPDIVSAKCKIVRLTRKIGMNGILPVSSNDVYTVLSDGVNPERLKNNPGLLTDHLLKEISIGIATCD